MQEDARHALSTIQWCIEHGYIRLTRHFRMRLVQRAFLWADVLLVLEEPTRMLADGIDHLGRSRWLVSGLAANGEAMTLVCAIGRDESGELTVFVTAYWEN